jgi:hypothetical protein
MNKNHFKKDKTIIKSNNSSENPNTVSDEDYYLPDEELTSENSSEPSVSEKKKLSPKIIVRITVLIFIAVVAFLFWSYRDTLTPQKIYNWFQTKITGQSVGDGYPISIEGSNVSTDNFSQNDGNCVYVSSTAMTVTDSLGKQVFSVGHSYSDPALAFSGNRYILWNIGGTGYTIVQSTDNISKETYSDKIHAADISESGTYAILSESTDYASSVKIYNKNNVMIYSYQFADGYGSAVALSPDSSMCIVTTISEKDGELYSKLTVLDFASATPKSEYTSDGNLITKLKWLKNGTIYAVGDSSISVGSSAGDFSDISYEGKTLTASNFSSTKAFISVTSYAHNGPSTLMIISSSDNIQSVSFDNRISAISSYSTTVAVLEGHTIQTYDFSSGTMVAKADSGYDANGITLVNENSAFVLGVSQIRFITLVNNG